MDLKKSYREDIQLFQTPDMVNMASYMEAQLIQEAQQVTGAVDYLMGTSAGRGVTETATGIKTITEQALLRCQWLLRMYITIFLISLILS